MNSMSRGYYDSCGKDKRKDDNCQALVKCGCPSSVQIPAIAQATTTTLTLASLSLDTSCYCDPNIKLDFASNVVSTVEFSGTISIQVFKQCRGQIAPVPVGSAWQLGGIAADSSTTFSFFVCDSDSCVDDCCTYSVVATVNAPSDEAVTAGTSINNSTLAATVTCKNSCNRCHR